jgi:hypothetical protein
MTAATIAYFAWTSLAAFLVLVVSAGLGMIAPLMQRKLSA